MSIEMKFQPIFQLQTIFTTNIIASKHTGSIIFEVRLENICISVLKLTHWNEVNYCNYKE